MKPVQRCGIFSMTRDQSPSLSWRFGRCRAEKNMSRANSAGRECSLAINSGANINFDSLGYVIERAWIGMG